MPGARPRRGRGNPCKAHVPKALPSGCMATSSNATRRCRRCAATTSQGRAHSADQPRRAQPRDARSRERATKPQSEPSRQTMESGASRGTGSAVRCATLSQNGYGARYTHKRSRFRRHANEVASERMQTKSPQKECKRSRFRRHAREPLAECKRSRFRRHANESRCRKNANEVASERMQTKSLQNTCKRSRFRKNAIEVASERMQTKSLQSLQKECKRSRFRKNANEVAPERMQTKSLQKECKRNRYGKSVEPRLRG